MKPKLKILLIGISAIALVAVVVFSATNGSLLKGNLNMDCYEDSEIGMELCPGDDGYVSQAPVVQNQSVVPPVIVVPSVSNMSVTPNPFDLAGGTNKASLSFDLSNGDADTGVQMSVLKDGQPVGVWGFGDKLISRTSSGTYTLTWDGKSWDGNESHSKLVTTGDYVFRSTIFSKSNKWAGVVTDSSFKVLDYGAPAPKIQNLGIHSSIKNTLDLNGGKGSVTASFDLGIDAQGKSNLIKDNFGADFFLYSNSKQIAAWQRVDQIEKSVNSFSLKISANDSLLKDLKPGDYTLKVDLVDIDDGGKKLDSSSIPLLVEDTDPVVNKDMALKNLIVNPSTFDLKGGTNIAKLSVDIDEIAKDESLNFMIYKEGVKAAIGVWDHSFAEKTGSTYTLNWHGYFSNNNVLVTPGKYVFEVKLFQKDKGLIADSSAKFEVIDSGAPAVPPKAGDNKKSDLAIVDSNQNLQAQPKQPTQDVVKVPTPKPGDELKVDMQPSLPNNNVNAQSPDKNKVNYVPDTLKFVTVPIAKTQAVSGEQVVQLYAFKVKSTGQSIKKLKQITFNIYSDCDTSGLFHEYYDKPAQSKCPNEKNISSVDGLVSTLALYVDGSSNSATGGPIDITILDKGGFAQVTFTFGGGFLISGETEKVIVIKGNISASAPYGNFSDRIKFALTPIQKIYINDKLISNSSVDFSGALNGEAKDTGVYVTINKKPAYIPGQKIPRK